MCATEQEKIIDTIRKLLNLADMNRNNSEREAMAAAMKAQQLMAKHNIDIAQVESSDNVVEEIIKETVSFKKNTGYCIKWRFQLAGVVAKNFRVKFFCFGKDDVVFYGYKTDVKIAVEVFNFLFVTGNKLSVKYYYKCQKEGRPTHGAMNEFLMGFVQGLKDVLEKQCVALMIQTPKEVEESYNNYSKNFKTFSAKVSRSFDREAFENGRTEGRFAANSRSIEAST